ncbi:MAG: ProQ/FINO family protein [Candidatus Paracaedibacter sp.]
MVNLLDAERAAQREEFLKRESKAKKPIQNFSFPPKLSKPSKVTKLKALSFEEKLELTNQWLEENFTHLFAADNFVLLDPLLLRDLKADYKHNALKKRYPQDLVIKAALSRYKQSIGYLECIREGEFYMNLKGEQVGIVSKQEEETAKEILQNL